MLNYIEIKILRQPIYPEQVLFGYVAKSMKYEARNIGAHPIYCMQGIE